MGNRVALWVLVLVMCFAVVMGVVGHEGGRKQREDKEREGEGEGEGEGGKKELFLLKESKHVMKTDAGHMKVVRGYGGGFVDRPMNIGFITMEPKTLFLPQYLDCSLILFVDRGEAKVGSIYKDQLVEKHLSTGDVYTIEAGSAFYLVNTGEGQRLHIICSIDTTESLGIGPFQSFFIGGGTYPTSVLAGFDLETLSAALNMSKQDLEDMMTRQEKGPIIYISESHQPSIWTQFLQLKQNERLENLKMMTEFEEEEDDDDDQEEEQRTWSWRKLLNAVFGEENRRRSRPESHKAPDPYNLYKRHPDFKNDYGSSIALDKKDYPPLKRFGIGIYHVKLSAGSMMAPHLNPTATEYGIVLRGSGLIQVAFPNGTTAMNARVEAGDVFWIPRYLAFCQIASRAGPFEFFGFTTSAHMNRPQFLAGARSILKTLRGPEIAAAFGVSLEVYDRAINAQPDAIIVRVTQASALDKMKVEEEKVVPKVIKSLGNGMTIDFD